MGDHTYKATVEIGDKKVTFEGPREFVEAQVYKITGGAPSKHITGVLTDGAAGSATAEQLSEREFVLSKQPKGHLETVAVLAFALTQTGTEEFTEGEIRRAYLRAGVRPPKVVAQALRDAKNRLDYLESGRRKGTYRLSSHGDRTVRFDLPRQ
jgi:hypothetical protein